MKDLRQRLYSGEIMQRPSMTSSLSLVEKINSLISQQFGLSPRTIHTVLNNADFLSQLAIIREKLNDSDIRNLAWSILKETNFDINSYVIDHIRLRAVVPNAHEIPEAKVAYAAHRDTWYSNSQSQINCWIPLHDVIEEEGFEIFPNYFSQAVDNASNDFDYEIFRNSVGFQGQKKNQQKVTYPALIGEIDESESVSIYGEQGSLHFFSAAHLHRTRCIVGQYARFSLEFRFVHLLDNTKRIGAPNVDNQSHGSATDDYFRFEKL